MARSYLARRRSHSPCAALLDGPEPAGRQARDDTDPAPRTAPLPTEPSPAQLWPRGGGGRREAPLRLAHTDWLHRRRLIIAESDRDVAAFRGPPVPASTISSGDGVKAKPFGTSMFGNRVVEDAFREADVRLVSMTAIGQRPIATAFREGWAAGERVNLNRPVEGDTRGLLV